MLGFQGKDLGLGAWAIWMSVDADVGDVPDAGAAVFKSLGSKLRTLLGC